MKQKIKTPITAATENEGINENFQNNYNLQPKDCNYFINCNAPICPFDKDWNKRKHIKGEAICKLIRDHAKNASNFHYKVRYTQTNSEMVSLAYPLIVAQYSPIRHELAKYSNQISYSIKAA